MENLKPEKSHEKKKTLVSFIRIYGAVQCPTNQRILSSRIICFYHYSNMEILASLLLLSYVLGVVGDKEGKETSRTRTFQIIGILTLRSAYFIISMRKLLLTWILKN